VTLGPHKIVIPAKAGIHWLATDEMDPIGPHKIVIPAKAGIQWLATDEMDPIGPHKIVIPAKAGIQWLATDENGSPLSRDDASCEICHSIW